LYAAVARAGWPDAPDDVRIEQQGQAAAAAWRMVSERKPNEDIRRLKPDVDLLAALADVPNESKRPVRQRHRPAPEFGPTLLALFHFWLF
jgi:hypothetical protein